MCAERWAFFALHHYTIHLLLNAYILFRESGNNNSCLISFSLSFSISLFAFFSLPFVIWFFGYFSPLPHTKSRGLLMAVEKEYTHTPYLNSKRKQDRIHLYLLHRLRLHRIYISAFCIAFFNASVWMGECLTLSVLFFSLSLFLHVFYIHPSTFAMQLFDKNNKLFLVFHSPNADIKLLYNW